MGNWSNTEHPNWPLTKAQIISFKFNNQTEITNHYAQYYPAPKKETPAMLERMHRRGKTTYGKGKSKRVETADSSEEMQQTETTSSPIVLG
jgi:hypothetical protein